MTTGRLPGTAALATAVLLHLAGAAAAAPLRGRAMVTPSSVRIGERVTYRAILTGDSPGRLRIIPPVSGGDLTWSVPAVCHRTGGGNLVAPDRSGWHDGISLRDTLWFESTLQVFRPGVVSVAGPMVQIDLRGAVRETRLPLVTLLVVPVITPEDTIADLRPLRGVIQAPWYERVPWLVVVAGAVALVAAIVVARWLRRRRRPADLAPRVPGPARPPLEQALLELAALRREGLPSQGRFAEHAFRLTLLLRRFLERIEQQPRPGDTTPELITRLRAAHLGADSLQRLEGLLRRWDAVKFARVPTSVEEAQGAESATEVLVRRLGAPAAAESPATVRRAG